ncbi:conjugal transfer protein TraM [Nitrosomonas supralitoralis]|nr:conjugal transfer protein TraM [Nitrosomonas supralitoralis]
MDEVIQQIAAAHGVVLSKDDPIMMLHTMNDHLIKENKSAQQDLLDSFRSQMELFSDQWSVEAKNHSDRILNSSIVSSKAEVARVMEEQSRVILEQWKHELSSGFSQVHNTIQASRQTAIYHCFIHYVNFCRYYSLYLFNDVEKYRPIHNSITPIN